MAAVSERMAPIDIINETLKEIVRLSSSTDIEGSEDTEYLTAHVQQSIDYYKSSKVDAEEFSRICQAMEVLSGKTDAGNDVIQSLFNATLLALKEPEEPIEATFSVGSSLYDRVMSIPIALTYMFWDYFWDGDHPWKMQKYALGLEGVVDSFKEMPMELPDILHTIEKDTTPLQKLLIPVIKSLLTDKESEVPYLRTIYQNEFIKNLRAAITSDVFLHEIDQHEKGNDCDIAVFWLLQIIYFRYTNVHIYSFCERLAEALIHEGRRYLYEMKNPTGFTEPQETALTIPLKEQFEAIDFAPQDLKAPRAHIEKGKAQGALGKGFDPHGKNNVPFVGYEVEVEQTDGRKKTVPNIRMGTPTIQDSTVLDSTAIIPEFDLFIRTLKINHLKCLYINLQDDRYEGVSSLAEWYRAQAIKKLHGKYPENFLVVCFSMDSPFYKQEGAYAVISNAGEFKKKILHEWLEKENSGSFFPQAWRDDSKFIELLQKTISDTQIDLFGEKAELSIAERQIMIDISIALLSLKFLSYSGVDIFAAACKDGLDRAGLINYLCRLIVLITHNKEDDEELQRMNHVSIHGPTIIVKKQGMNGRRKRLIQARDYLMQPEIKEKLRLRAEELFVTSSFKVRQKAGLTLWSRPSSESDTPPSV